MSRKKVVKKSTGRPPLFKETMRLINFRCTAEQNEWLDKKAESLKIDRAKLIRQIIDQEIQKSTL